MKTIFYRFRKLKRDLQTTTYFEEFLTSRSEESKSTKKITG